MKIKAQSAIAYIVGFVGLAGVVLAPIASAANTTTITARIAKTAAVATTGGSVLINVTPSAAGSFSSASDTVTAGTNSTAGYQLQISAAATALTKGSDTIAAGSATPGTPAALAVNTWGFRVDGQGGFGTGPTTAATNAASLTGLWAGVTSTAVTIKTTAVVANADTTTVWYGVGTDFTKPNGDYTTTVTYTAVAN